MAGGSGTRLWPLSRQGRPKQVLKLIGDQTMFEIAVGRLAPLFPPERIFILASGDLADELSRQAPQLPREAFIVEPEGRGTAPAIGLGAVYLRRRDPNAIMACLTADHYIADPARFRDVLTAAAQVAAQGYLVTLGIPPTFPATGFGYVERGAPIGAFDGIEAYRALKFKEKPSQPRLRPSFSRMACTVGTAACSSGASIASWPNSSGSCRRHMQN
ncbi:MAG: NTP transferase domain-containing protein [Chloroflexi bacterium]|nr:NTP transferase domain-containing protein [Chloroflexota bacterium]